MWEIVSTHYVWYEKHKWYGIVWYDVAYTLTIRCPQGCSTQTGTYFYPGVVDTRPPIVQEFAKTKY